MRNDYVFLFFLAASLALLILGAGCSKQIPKCPAPDGQSEMHCFAAKVRGDDVVLCSTATQICGYARDQAEKYATLAEIESLGDCKHATVSVTVKE